MHMSNSKSGHRPLAIGGIFALLASACCLGPLILITLGISGAWVANLTALEPYRPVFIIAALSALYFAWRRIYRPTTQCQPQDICTLPTVRTAYKLIFWGVSTLILIAFVYPYILPLFY
jgi:mercuric ion transport protein